MLWPRCFEIAFSAPPNPFLLLCSARLGELKHLLVVINSQGPHMYLQTSRHTTAREEEGGAENPKLPDPPETRATRISQLCYE